MGGGVDLAAMVFAGSYPLFSQPLPFSPQICTSYRAGANPHSHIAVWETEGYHSLFPCKASRSASPPHGCSMCQCGIAAPEGKQVGSCSKSIGEPQGAPWHSHLPYFLSINVPIKLCTNQLLKLQSKTRSSG